MAAVRLPPVRERQRPNGDGFAPRPMIRMKRGRLRKGGTGGKTKAGETAAPRLPAAPKPAPRSGSGYSGAPFSPAGDVTGGACEAWRGPWARPIPRERSSLSAIARLRAKEEAVRKTYLHEAPGQKSFPHRGKLFSIAWKISEIVFHTVKNSSARSETTRIRD